MAIIQIIVSIVTGCMLSGLLLAIKSDFHPECRGLANRWLCFFWCYCLPASTFPAFIVIVILLAGGL